MLQRIATFSEHQEDLKAKVIGALAYPAFLAVTAFVVLMVLVVVFVPMFEPIFKGLEQKNELPFLTSVVVGFSHLIIDWWFVFPFLGIGAVVAYWKFTSSEAARFWIDSVRLRIPVIGTVYLNFALSRFTRILGTLLRNGIPILQSLKIAKDSMGNRVLSAAIADGRRARDGRQQTGSATGVLQIFASRYRRDDLRRRGIQHARKGASGYGRRVGIDARLASWN